MEEGVDGAIWRMRTKIGVLPFAVARTGGDCDYKVTMTQGRIELAEPLAADVRRKLLDRLGLSEADLDRRCPVQIASTGHSKVLIGITSRDRLNGLAPDLAGLAALSGVIGCNGYFVFSFDSGSPGVLTCGRMFAPAIGIAEDPVTGNANGPLGAYLVHHGLVDNSGSEFRFLGRQGEAMNRPGLIEVIVKIAERQPVLVQVAGEAVVVFRTEIAI